VMGAGYEYMDEAIHGRFTWQFLLILVGLKIVATLLSFVSGTPGGLFAPTLFIGAVLGAAVGGIEHALLPHLTASPATYALVGMGVLFAGFIRAPMTSVFMILEISGNYSIILPVVIANGAAYTISRALMPVSIFDILTRQDGLELPSMEEQREENVLRIEDAMQPPNAPVVEGEDSVEKALRTLDKAKQEIVLVRLKPVGGLAGWSGLSRAELAELIADDKANQAVGSLLAFKQIPLLHPDMPLDVVLRYVDRWPVLPVVNRANLRKLDGIITERDVLERYRDFSGE
jgi:chloride channel protein, CIC family